jgi:trimeric autotransporter adhesin
VIEMKTFRTIATVLLAAFLVLGPVAAFAAGETVTVSTNAGSYSGNAAIQVAGTVTPAPTAAGTDVVVTTTGPMGAVDTGTAPVAATSGTFSYVLVAGAPSWVTGNYVVNATYGGPGGTGSGTAKFVYLGATSGNSSVITITTTVTSTTTVGVQTVTSTTTVPSSDAAALTSIQASLTSITNTLGTITSSLNTISSGITGIQNSITSSTSGFGALAGVPAQITTLSNNVNNDGTYVLVVAALAAITLVLELAILVRKLS